MARESRPDRANPKAWRRAFVAAVPAYLVLLALVLPRAAGDDYSTAVEIALPTLLAAVAVGAMAADAKRVWRWQRYLTAVSAITAVAMTLALLAHETVGRGEAGQDANSGASANSPRGTGSTLWIPDRVGSWTLVDTQAARERQQVLEQKGDRYSSDVSVAYGEYRRHSAQVRFRAYNSKPNSRLRTELQHAPTSAIRDYLSGARVQYPRFVDAGDNDVTMACGEPRQYRSGVVLCAWADAFSMGSTVWIIRDLSINRAADLTRSFRRHVSRPNDWSRR